MCDGGAQEWANERYEGKGEEMKGEKEKAFVQEDQSFLSGA